MLVVCERWAGDGDRLLYLHQSSSDHSSSSFSSWLGCSTVGHWGPKALCLPLVLSSASCPHLIQAVCVLIILLFNVHMFPLFFRLFTQVHLLIDGSVEGQYVTVKDMKKVEEHIVWNVGSITVYIRSIIGIFLVIYIYIYIYICNFGKLKWKRHCCEVFTFFQKSLWFSLR